MEELKQNDIVGYVEENIGSFHQKRLEVISKLSLSQTLKRKNPYLFKAKNVFNLRANCKVNCGCLSIIK